MAEWPVPSTPIDPDDINHGNEFVDNDGVRAEDINNTVKAALYAQETAEQVREDVSDLDDRVTELEEGGGTGEKLDAKEFSNGTPPPWDQNYDPSTAIPPTWTNPADFIAGEDETVYNKHRILAGIYCVDEDGNQVILPFSLAGGARKDENDPGETDPNGTPLGYPTFVMYNSANQILCCRATDVKHAVPLGQLQGYLADKLDKAPATTANARKLYGTNNAGGTYMWKVLRTVAEMQTSEGGVLGRADNSYFAVPDPTAEYGISNKRYVDSRIGNAIRGVIVCKFVTTTANDTITLQNLTGMTSIDWGDGTVDSLLTHTYTTRGTYYAVIYGVTSVGTNAFSDVYQLQGIIIGDNVSSVGNGAFQNTYNLGFCKLPSGITYINANSFFNSGILSIEIPSTVTFIVGFRLSQIRNIKIPSSVNTIGNDAFYSCTKLKSITIPANVSLIAQGAFSGCTSLQKIVLEGTTPPTISTPVFDNTNNCPIYVPPSALNAYKTDTNWSTYASRIVANATTKYVDTQIASARPIPKWGIYQNQWVTDDGIVFDLGVSIETMNFMCQCRFCGAKIYHSETVSGHPAITCPTCGQSSYLTEEGFTSDTSGGSTTPHYWRDENENRWKDYADYPNQHDFVIKDGLCPVCSALFDYDTYWFEDDCPNCHTRLTFGAVDGVDPNITIYTP